MKLRPMKTAPKGKFILVLRKWREPKGKKRWEIVSAKKRDVDFVQQGGHAFFFEGTCAGWIPIPNSLQQSI